MVDFAAGIVANLGEDDHINNEAVRVAAVKFDTDVTTLFGFDSMFDADRNIIAGADREIASLLTSQVFANTLTLTQTNFDVALDTVRTEVLATDGSSAGFRMFEYPVHVVVLTDGNSRPAEEGYANLLAELNDNAVWNQPGVTRWAFEIGSQVNGTALDAIASDAAVNRGPINAASQKNFVHAVEFSEQCESTTPTTTETSTTPTTTTTATTTTTPTSHHYHRDHHGNHDANYYAYHHGMPRNPRRHPVHDRRL